MATSLAQKVFPAPAGINRGVSVWWEIKNGVPRASGDKPGETPAAPRAMQCSPRQRG
ncbi:hypothetical protein IHZ88_001689 [Salmonella enterica]|nr:hypothetical protein [Salmonella enterica subsp. diarizonae]EGN4149459.1 hypothetical protein [Salmonella enterica]EHG8819843.1 hypothetical protein [Salmonella enterica subsp. diarizonae serovar 61:k:1,5,(7)]